MQKTNTRPQFEFVALMASLMSIVALALDALLPALSHIGIAINSLDPIDNQMLITMIFLGLGVGQLFFGPLSDSYGRKPIVYIGFVVFLIASIICIFAQNLEMMLVGRVLQGIGLSAPRTIAISIIRDMYKGDYMAKIMSFVTAFFILVPVVAPAVGKIMMDNFGWEAIFYLQLFFALVVGIWFWKRQPETLKPEYKISFTKNIFFNGLREFIKYKETVAFTLVSGLVTGAFLVYLSSAQHIFENLYGLVDEFPYIFAGLAASIGISTFLNGTLVLHFGMRKLSYYALIAFSLTGLLFVILFWNSPNPSLLVLIVFLFIQFFCLGFVWGNLRSIAMEPIGHIAGIGAAINGFISTLLAIPIATFIGSYINTSVLPVFIGLTVCGFVSIVFFMVVKKRKEFSVG